MEDNRSWVESRLGAWGQSGCDIVIVERVTGRFLGSVRLNQINRVHNFL
jgi:hypothetical protein